MGIFARHTVKPHARELAGKSSEARILCALWHFVLVDGILYSTSKSEADHWRLVIPQSMCTETLKMLHRTKWAGHPGVSRIKASICLRCYWPSIHFHIESWVRCRSCTMSKCGRKHSKAALQQETAGSSFQLVVFDIIGSLPTTVAGNKCIWVVVDDHTKCSNTYHTAETVAYALTTEWIVHYRVPLRLHCDDAHEFHFVLHEVRNLLGVRG